MFARKFVSSLILAASVLAPSLSFAAPATNGMAFLLSEYHVTSVSPYLKDDHFGKVSLPRVHGASIYVAAEPGLTAEWLQLRIEQHLAEMRRGSMPDCAFDVGNLRVEVDSAGAGFAVRVISGDTARAAEILRRARLLVDA